MAMEAQVQEDVADGNMQCADHPYKNSSPGGICALCLQEKLGKLVSSSFPIAIFPSASSSSSPSFRSDYGAAAAASVVSIAPNASSASSSSANALNHGEYHRYHSRRCRIPFLASQKKKKKELVGGGGASDQAGIVFKRSKSTATPRRRLHFVDADEDSPRRRGFWSFLYLSKHSSGNRKTEKQCKESCYDLSSANVSFSQTSRKEENESPDEAALGRKVSRSRSVGCGSRSFSGDFFERISTGFGDCTLRRVESHREGKSKATPVHQRGAGGGQDCIKERVKCGGIFSGFMVTSSSSSSSSSSYLVSSSVEDSNVNEKASVHGRSKSWVWAFASPMRAFSKPSSSTGKTEAPNKNPTPNLVAIPSLLAVRS